MKKIFYFLLFMLAVSCRKEDNENTADNVNRPSSNAESIPQTFTQKLLLEMYSTTGCATCPDAEYKYRQYATAHPDLIYGVCIHTSDAMSTPQFNVLDNALDITAFSSGSFNRIAFNGVSVLHKTTWNNTIINTCLNKTASCGLKLNTIISGNTAQIAITAGFNQLLSGDYRLTAYIVEDSVTGTGTGYNQSNYYNNISTSIYYMLGNPIVGYEHNCVLRQVITPAMGDVIPAGSMKAGGIYANSYSVNIAGYNHSRLYLIAMINKVGNSPTTHEIMNVQRVKLGLTKAFD
jgi:hypothetical protein